MTDPASPDPAAASPESRLLAPPTPLRHLRLAGTPLQPRVARRLACLVAHHPTLQTLDVSNCGLSPANAGELLVALGTAARVALVDLSRNPLGANAGQLLGEALAGNRSLVRLRLAQTQLDAAAARHLAQALATHPRLQAIDLSDNPIGAAGFAAMAPVLAPRPGQPQGGVPRIRSVALARCDGGPAALAALCPSARATPPRRPWLHTLMLRGNRAHHAPAAWPALLQVVRLDLSYNDLGSAGVRALAAALPHTDVLQELALQAVGAAAPAWAALAQALAPGTPRRPANTSLRTLHLDQNTLGTAAHSFEDPIQTHPTLQLLTLSRCGIGIPECAGLATRREGPAVV